MRGIDLGLEIDALRAGDALVRKVLGAGTEAIRSVTRALELDLEDMTRAVIPGRAWRAWRSQTNPRPGRIAREPAGTVFLNGRDRTRGMIAFWTTPGRVQGKSGQWLAIPLDAAGSRGRGRNLTPGEWERATGTRLRFVYRGGNRSALLVADIATTNARTGAFRPITRRRTAADQKRGYYRGQQTVPIFVLVPWVAHANAFSIRPRIDQSSADIAAEFIKRTRAIRS